MLDDLERELRRALAAARGRRFLGPALALDLVDARADRVAVPSVVVGHEIEAREQGLDLHVGVGSEQLARVVEPRERRPSGFRVARVDVGPAVLVDAHGDEALRENALDARIGEHVALELAAPAAPRGAHEEQDRQPALARQAEWGLRPVEPVHVVSRARLG